METLFAGKQGGFRREERAMDYASSTHKSDPFRRGTVIAAAAEMAAIQTPGGDLVSADRLGPGIVEQMAQDGRVCVRWIGADFETCLDPGDVKSLGPNAHLITMKQRDKQGHIKLLKHRVVTTGGLDHNWTAEMLPGNTIRVLRSDGSAWTFGFNWIFKSVVTWWTQPPNDDDAEAVAVAEIASRDLR